MTEDQPQGTVVPLESAPQPIDPGVTIGHVHLRTADIDRDALRRLRAAEWPVRQASDHGTHEAIYISDPDGNDLELTWDRPFDAWPRDALGHLQGLFDDLDLDALAAGG